MAQIPRKPQQQFRPQPRPAEQRDIPENAPLESKEEPLKPMTEPPMETKEVESESSTAVGETNSASDQNQSEQPTGYYYRQATRVVRYGYPVSFKGHRAGVNQIVVDETVVQEVALPGATKQFGTVLLFTPNTELSAMQAQAYGFTD